MDWNRSLLAGMFAAMVVPSPVLAADVPRSLFAYHDADYKQRVDPQALLAAARDALR